MSTPNQWLFEETAEALESARKLPRDEAYELLRDVGMHIEPGSELWMWFAPHLAEILDLDVERLKQRT
jgi:hypothetical protein